MPAVPALGLSHSRLIRQRRPSPIGWGCHLVGYERSSCRQTHPSHARCCMPCMLPRSWGYSRNPIHRSCPMLQVGRRRLVDPLFVLFLENSLQGQRSMSVANVPARELVWLDASCSDCRPILHLLLVLALDRLHHLQHQWRGVLAMHKESSAFHQTNPSATASITSPYSPTISPNESRMYA